MEGGREDETAGRTSFVEKRLRPEGEVNLSEHDDRDTLPTKRLKHEVPGEKNRGVCSGAGGDKMEVNTKNGAIGDRKKEESFAEATIERLVTVCIYSALSLPFFLSPS